MELSPEGPQWAIQEGKNISFAERAFKTTINHLFWCCKYSLITSTSERLLIPSSPANNLHDRFFFLHVFGHAGIGNLPPLYHIEPICKFRYVVEFRLGYDHGESHLRTLADPLIDVQDDYR